MARKIEVEITGDTKSLERALNRSGKTADKWGDRMRKASKIAAVGLVALGAGAIKATRDASHLNEMISATNVVFGKSADAILDWSKDTTDAFSQADFLGAAKSFAVFAQQAGLGEKATADFSKSLLEAAGDLASFHDADPSEVLADLRSGLAGETEPLRKYGILVDEATLAQQGMKMGLVESGEALTAREKIIARQALILDQLGAAQGDWNRTRDSAANRERAAIANAQDLSAQLGQALLPAYQKILAVALSFVQLMSRHKTATKAVVIAVAALAAGLIVATAAQTAMNLAVLANPYVAAAVAVIALGAAIVFLVTKVDFFRRHWQLLLLGLGLFPMLVATVVKAVIRHFDTLKGWFEKVKEAGRIAFQAVRGYILDLVGPLLTVIDTVQSAIGWFKDLIGISNSSTGSGIGAAAGRARGAPANPNIPEGATGGRVGRTGLAIIHKGEDIIPASRTGWGSGDIVVQVDGMTLLRATRRAERRYGARN